MVLTNLVCGSYHCTADLLFNWIGLKQTSYFVGNVYVETNQTESKADKVTASEVFFSVSKFDSTYFEPKSWGQILSRFPPQNINKVIRREKR